MAELALAMLPAGGEGPCGRSLGHTIPRMASVWPCRRQHGIQRREQPTQIVEHRPVNCPVSHLRLRGISLAQVRQVIDVPPPLAVEVREHRIYKGWCAGCGKWHEAPIDLNRFIIEVVMNAEHTPEQVVKSGRSPGSSHTHFRQVPLPITPLIGREHEVQEACILLRNPEVHLLTITGPGGIGKTRLALQVASDVQWDFTDGSSFVALAHLTDPHQLALTIAQALGLRESKRREPFERLRTFLYKKHLLLLLDNFEQILAAAPLLPELLSNCPQLKILVTSRAVLRVQGEYELLVPQLPVPDLQQLLTPESIVQYGAVALFVQRAQAIQHDFRVTEENAHDIAAICARLDGLPLAIELAAAHIKLLPPRLLLSRLEKPLDVLTRGGPDLPARHQTLRDTIAWSYDLLSPEEQQAFRRLSVFVGGSTLEAVEAVCASPGGEASSVVDVVASLLDKSLLQQVKHESEELRLVMSETIREYSLERLATSGELESARHAHATYYLELAEKAEPASLDMHQRIWLEELERERDNLNAALHWLLEHKDVEAALRLASALRQFWFLRGSLHEGSSFLERALAASKEDNISPSSPFSELTAREVDVLRLLATGLTNNQIAERLVISSKTVNIHVASIYKKLEVTSRTAATRFAIEHGFL